jgi:hypothetical protein
VSDFSPGNPLTPYQYARMIEERSLTAWPALRQVYYDGWVLRFANGYSRRNNSVNPFFGSSFPVPEKVAYCETVCSAWNIPLTFRVTPFTQPYDLDEWLAGAGYSRVSPTSVQVAELVADTETVLPATVKVHCWSVPGDDWLRAYTGMNQVPVTKHAALRDILAHIPLELCADDALYFMINRLLVVWPCLTCRLWVYLILLPRLPTGNRGWVRC